RRRGGAYARRSLDALAGGARGAPVGRQRRGGAARGADDRGGRARAADRGGRLQPQRFPLPRPREGAGRGGPRSRPQVLGKQGCASISSIRTTSSSRTAWSTSTASRRW